MVKRFLFLLSCSLFSSTLFAEELQERIDGVVKQCLEEFQVPGVAVGVIKEGKVVLAHGWGTRDLEAHLPVTEETLFEIASCSKAFTTFLLGQLVDEGKLSWDDPVVKYLPTFTLHDPQLTKEITIRDLVAHRTGIPSHDALWFFKSTARSDFLSLLPHLNSLHPLRTQWCYSNIMYTIAGLVIEKVTGKTWEEAVATSIFSPLEMKKAHALHREEGEIAFPYGVIQGRVTRLPFHNLDPIAAGAGIEANVTEMLKWADRQLTPQGLISQATLEEMHTTQILLKPDQKSDVVGVEPEGYGLGWFTGHYKGHKVVSHTGSISGFASEVILLPEQKTGIVLLCNSSSGGRFALQTIRNTLFDALLNLPPQEWFLTLQKRKEESRGSGALIDHSDLLSSPLASYVGVYHHPAYGNLQVFEEGEQLVLLFCGQKVPLFYQPKGTFRGAVEALQVFDKKWWTDIHFLEDQKGMEITLEPNVGPIAFKTDSAEAALTLKEVEISR